MTTTQAGKKAEVDFLFLDLEVCTRRKLSCPSTSCAPRRIRRFQFV